MGSLDCIWVYLGSLGFTLVHFVSLGFTCVQLGALESTSVDLRWGSYIHPDISLYIDISSDLIITKSSGCRCTANKIFTAQQENNTNIFAVFFGCLESIKTPFSFKLYTNSLWLSKGGSEEDFDSRLQSRTIYSQIYQSI